MSDERHERPEELLTWSRREVLALGSAAAVVGLVPKAVQAAVAVTAKPAPLSVGYVVDSDLLPDLRHLAWLGRSATFVQQPSALAVTPASSLNSGDIVFTSGAARVRVIDLFPPSWASGPTGLALTVRMQSEDPAAAGPLPFYAWSTQRAPFPARSHPVAFDVPIGRDGGLELMLEVKSLTAGGKTKNGVVIKPTAGSQLFATRFTIGSERGVPRLRRGIYLLGTDSVSWEQPRTIAIGTKSGIVAPLSIVLSIEPVIEGAS